MDILASPPIFNLQDYSWRIYSKNPIKPPHYVANEAEIMNSCITEGCNIYGFVENSVISDGVTIEKGAIITNSVVFPNVYIGEGTVLNKTIVGENTVIGKGVISGMNNSPDNPHTSKLVTDDMVLIGGNLTIGANTEVFKNSMVRTDIQ